MSKQKKGHYVRINRSTQRAINKVIGELQRQTGENQSADSALRYMIEQTFPKIAEEESLIEENGNGEDTDDDEES